MSELNFIDLFAGCGGFSLGLSMAGLRGSFAIERDEMAFDTFQANFLGETSRVEQFAWPSWLDKRAWDIEELLAKHTSNLKRLRGRVDILAGGPPCQGFSYAGRRNESDPRNSLFKRYVEVVEAVQPKIIILENVPGMTVAHGTSNVVSLKAKAANRESYYDKLVTTLGASGYVVDSRMLDASRYGVPQRRLRLIAVGMKAELAAALDGGVAYFFDAVKQARQEQLGAFISKTTVTAAQAISDLETADQPLKIWEGEKKLGGYFELDYSGPRTRFQRQMHALHTDPMDSMRLAKHRADIRKRFAEIQKKCRSGVRMDAQSREEFGLKKLRIHLMAPDKPAPTITTLPDDILHYSEPRILTVRECARLQSFPDWFRFKGKYTTGGVQRTKECPRYTQVGNAVPPLLARTLGLAIRKTLSAAAMTSPKSISRHPTTTTVAAE